ncbi:MAG: histidine phosphatase family protein [Thauera phenolivorans]|uniref:Histidine phosphatase family protein n=1 Tax=Thauera phenolivorans TaxID=1792543 RepID=A0A7X7LVT4_9RHOO|nr:histidine phosphatase family protein [Thauera phenolivorans]NLF54218.1 histidine phosphatase family protein [Thauera phenolivorans]
MIEKQHARHETRVCRICVIRHGETAWNAERRLQGHLDVPLNETGLAQADAAARHLADERFAALYTSDLLRTRQTATPLARSLAREMIREPRLRERHYGCFQGLTYEEAALRHPHDYARHKARDPDFALPGGGESLIAFRHRIAAALAEIAARHAGERVAVVTHGGVLDIIHRFASGQPLEAARDFPIPNAALNWIEFDDGRWRLLSWADQAHLQFALDELPDR